MFAGAAFTDSADFKVKTEVVDTLVQLGVINGYTDGSFKPNDTVTRAEMAKMIYVLRTGNSDASAYNNDKTTFTDVNGHWAAGYIKYCQSLGIIAGVSATQFKPDANVTAQEAAKMLLVTLGYNADKAGLVGINWASKTNALADENGLLEDVNTSFTAACPRQYAAQLIYNAIDTPTVVWRDDAYTNVNVLGNDNQTVGEKYMNLVKNEARTGKHDNILVKVEKEDGRDTYAVTVEGTDKDNKATSTTYTRVAKDYSDLMGQDVVVMSKKGDTSKVFGVYAAEDSKVLATGIIGDMEKVSGKGNEKKVKIDGTEYKFEGERAETSVYNFNSDVAVANKTVNSYVDSKSDALKADVAANTIKLVDNDGNGKADRVVIVPRSVNEVTYVGSSNFSLQYKGTIKFKDCESVYEGIAKDDYALYTDGDYTASGDHNVAKVDIVSGEVKGTKGSTGEFQVRVGDKWYYLASGIDQLESGTSYDLAVVGGVVFNADETEASSKDIVALVDIDESTNTGLSKSGTTQDAKVAFMDGSTQTIKVEKLNKADDGKNAADVKADSKDANGKTVTGNYLTQTEIGKLFTYSVKSNGNYELKLLGDKNKAGYKTVGDANEIAANNKINKNSIADDAVIFTIYDKDNGDREVKVLSGKTVNNWDKAYTGSVVYGSKEENGISYVKVASVKAAKKYSGMGSDYYYGYLTATPYTTTENPDGSTDKCTAFDIWNGTENVTVYNDGVYNGNNAMTGKAYKTGDILIYTLDGKYISVESGAGDIVATKAAVYGFDYKAKGNIEFKAADNTIGAYKLDDDCVFLAVNDKDNKGVGNNMNQLIKAQPDNKGGYVQNAWVIYNNDSDHDVVAVIFDVENNEWLS
nr:S-layer homology domain-containing protein [uncultured Agathobaculum sp.]